MFLLDFIKRIFVRKELRSSDNFINHLRKKGVSVGKNVLFRHPKHTTIDLTRPSLITIGDNVDFNDNFTIMTHDFGAFVFRNLYHEFVASSGCVNIGNNIYFGRNVTVLKGVKIGDNCIIGAGSIVVKDIPSNSVAVGIPCRVVSTLEEYFKKRKEQQVREAIDYGVSIMERFNREPVIEDFTEEWCLFMSRDDYNNPIVKKYADFRLQNAVNQHFKWGGVFGGFENFVRSVKEEYERKCKLS